MLWGCRWGSEEGSAVNMGVAGNGTWGVVYMSRYFCLGICCVAITDGECMLGLSDGIIFTD